MIASDIPHLKEQIVMRKPKFTSLLLLVLTFLIMPHPVRADSFDHWVAGVWPEARRAGVSRATFDAAFRGVRPDESIYESAASQPEFVKPIWEYLERAVSDNRVKNGKEKLYQFNNILNAIEAVYGVPRYVVLAIWGMETNYGGYLGDKNVIEALATLGYRGRRQRFGRKQLIAALQILERGDTTPDRMTGSWAGAMGHTQFIPTTYNAYAVDFDGDGRRDIWDTIADALASTASYLRVSGWRPDLAWGYEVQLPPNFDYSLIEAGTKTVREWHDLALRRPGARMEHATEQAQLLLPAGAAGPAFLVFKNFRAIKRYNNSDAYALAVGHLSDRISGGKPFAQSWPTDDGPLTRDQRKELQSLLLRAGYAIGSVDGKIGRKTRAAIRHFQNARGVTPDGFASILLLERLRRG
ncbi:MAG: lytic murein transglycosylase [Fimbriimonadaceae bacterium]|nr:lytic murein transglycosylase [Alphaproteobacteria bacterium]